MNTNEPNAQEAQKIPRRRQAAGKWWRVIPLAMIIVGAGIVSYPFWPGLKFAVARPRPVVPYSTKLSTVSGSFKALPQLPTVGNKPVPKDNRLVIPSIGVDMSILEGPTEKTLDLGGIWHIPNTSNPVKGGNMVLSGHRWQYLPPSSTTLYLLDKVQVHEPVIVYWHGQEYDYTINGREIVNPNRVDILNDTPQPKLTIFTCTPLFSTKQRLVLYGQLIT